jgi:hypothetical protein
MACESAGGRTCEGDEDFVAGLDLLAAERAAFPGRHGELGLNGERVRAAAELRPPGRSVSVVRVVVAPGTNAKVEVPGAAADAEQR